MDEGRRKIVRGIPFVAAGAAVLGAYDHSTSVRAEQGSKPQSSPKKVIPGTSPNFSRTVEFDRMLFVSGVLGVNPETRKLQSSEFEGQCRQVLTNLQASVEAGGSTLSQVLKCTCFLVEASDFEAFNGIYREFFPKDPPARSTVVVKELVMIGAKIEIDCVAHI